MERDILIWKQGIIEIQVVYIILDLFGTFNGLSSLCQTVLFVAVATPISKTFHLFLTVPLIIPRRIDSFSFSLFFFTKHVIFSIQSYTGTFFLLADVRKFLLSNANIPDLNYVSPCVYIFTSFHFFSFIENIETLL